jgi:hypothetical protein
MSQLSQQSVTLYFVWFSLWKAIIYLNSINQLNFVIVKCGVLFEVRTEFLKCYLDELRLALAQDSALG